MAITTADDIKVALVDPDFSMDEAVLNGLIDRAELLLAQSGYDLELLNPVAVRTVVSGMVARVLRNPDGIRQETETTGPSSRSVTYAGANPGGLYITPEDKALLTGKPHRAAFTIDLAPNAMQQFRGTPDTWYPTWGVEGL